MLTRVDAVALDHADPLSAWREQFLIADDTLVYLDGSSLGMTPRRTIDRLDRVFHDEWAAGLIGRGTNGSTFRSVSATPGAADRCRPGEVAVHDSTTVNLYQLVDAACAMRPDRRVDRHRRDEFPTDQIRGRRHRRRPWTAGARRLRSARRRCRDGPLGRRLPHSRGCRCRRRDGSGHRGRRLALWDLSHAVGVLAIDLAAAGVQIAVGCTYKYLNGGPGRAGVQLRGHRLQATLPQPIWGWFAQADQFQMGSTFVPQPDIRRVMLGSPSILALAAAEEGSR